MSRNWPHAPTHRLAEAGTFLVTAGTYGKAHYFRTAERLSVLERGLLKLAGEAGWRVEAWAVFSNHYHFVAHSPEDDAAGLPRILGELHSRTAQWINRRDKSPGRKVWCNYWETNLTHEKSYLARLAYTHHNAVKHRLVPVANQYPWCSAAWFERIANAAQVRTIYGFPTDRINVLDDFEPVAADRTP